MTRSPISFYKKIVLYKKVKIKKIFTKVNYFISVILPKLGENYATPKYNKSSRYF
ncbi:hypothetical protein [Coxiella burnetii]|uniref:hypothetical protein n=1 Tax=Coxiella burnetii TaxID=777 RepID=UPI000183CD26|nr:hypothetical protein [Coxiella burnetii]ACJ18440.1 hypothetical cytosolic protein [Coxiella burnetii CbuG_Q212]ATN66821.1 hypothetical protein AYM17_05345 [Coxiella burnetii]OYK86146.1 hypothetical protein CbuQ229_05575 [Coxiella burnetii]